MKRLSAEIWRASLLFALSLFSYSTFATDFTSMTDASGAAMVSGAYYRIATTRPADNNILMPNGTYIKPKTRTADYLADQAWQITSSGTTFTVAKPDASGYWTVNTNTWTDNTTNTVLNNGTSTTAQAWTGNAVSTNTYNITAVNGGTTYYFSHYGGGDNNMGFYSTDHNTDAGSLFTFTRVYKTTLTCKDQLGYTIASGTYYLEPNTYPTFSGVTYVSGASATLTDGGSLTLLYNRPLPITTSTFTYSATSWPTTGMNWYLMTLRGYYCVYNPSKGYADANVSSMPIASSDNAVWCFTGDVTNGYKVYNTAVGPTKILWETASDSKAGETFSSVSSTESNDAANTWLLKYSSGGWQFLKNGTTTAYMNNNSSSLGIWKSASAVGEVGSIVRFTKVYKVSFKFLANDGTTEVSGMGVTFNGGTTMTSNLFVPASTTLTSLTPTGNASTTGCSYYIGTDASGTATTNAGVITAIAGATSDLTITIKLASAPVTVTYKYLNVQGEALQTQTTTTFASGATYTAPTAPQFTHYTTPSSTTYKVGTADATTTVPTTITDATTVTYTYPLDVPFTTSTFSYNATAWPNTSDMHWYLLKLRGYYCVYNASTNGADATVTTAPTATSLTDNYLWCFTGNETSGYKIYNKAAGPTKILWDATTFSTPASGTYTTSAKVSMVSVSATESADAAKTWILKYGAAGSGTYYPGGWNLLIKGTTCAYANQISNAFAIWNSLTAPGEIGCVFIFTDILPTLTAYQTQLNNSANAVNGYTTAQLSSSGMSSATTVQDYMTAISNISSLTKVSFDLTKYYRLKNVGKSNYLSSDGSNAKIVTAANYTATNANLIWKFASSGSNYTLYNPATSTYVATVPTSASVTMTAASANVVVGAPFTDPAQFYIAANGMTYTNNNCIHNDGSNNAVGWEANGNTNSRWYLLPATELDITPHSVGTLTSGVIYNTYINNSGFNLTALPEGLKAYYVNSSTGAGSGTVSTTQISTINAGMSVILKGTIGTTYTCTPTSTADATATIANNLLTYSASAQTPASSANIYLFGYLSTDLTKPQFVKVDGGTVKANKVYLDLPDGTSPVKQLTIDFIDDITTGVSSVETTPNEPVVYYDLQGRRCEQPTHGLYICNGKKIFIR